MTDDPIKFKVAKNQEEVDECAVFVCATADAPSYFHDDVFDVCSKCQAKIRHRPDGPKHCPKVCINCAMPDIIKAMQAGELEITVTEKTIEEVAAIHLKKQN